MHPVLRIARPTDNLEALLPFYRDGLKLKLLYQFKDHNGFDGVMLGHDNAPYHFEFTLAYGHKAGRAPTKDNLVVFYFPDAKEWDIAIQNMREAGFLPVQSFNPYWDQKGATFEDPDGYRVVLQQAAWTY